MSWATFSRNWIRMCNLMNYLRTTNFKKLYVKRQNDANWVLQLNDDAQASISTFKYPFCILLTNFVFYWRNIWKPVKQETRAHTHTHDWIDRLIQLHFSNRNVLRETHWDRHTRPAQLNSAQLHTISHIHRVILCTSIALRTFIFVYTCDNSR